MIHRIKTRALLSTAIAATIALSAYTPTAEAMPAKPMGMTDAAPSLVETVQNRRRAVRPRRGGNAAAAAIGLGILGLAAGAAIAANQPRYYYDDPYYGGPRYRYYGGYDRPGYVYDTPRRYYGPRTYYTQRRGWRAPEPGYIPDAGGVVSR